MAFRRNSILDASKSSDDDASPIIENLVDSLGLEVDPENAADVAFQYSCKYNSGAPCSTYFKQEDLQNVRLGFMETDFFHGFHICRDTFKYLHNIGQDKLNNLITLNLENIVLM